MPDFEIKIDEALEKELQANIQRFLKRFPEALAEIIEVWANKVIDKAKTSFRYLTPWEVRQPTGNLLGSLRIKIEKGKSGLIAEIIAGGSISDISGQGASVTADVPYAVYVEFGTIHSRPNPYLRPAVESLLPELNRDLSKAFEHLKKFGVL